MISESETWTGSRRPTSSWPDSEYRLEVDFKALRRNPAPSPAPSRSLSGSDSEPTAEAGGATCQGSDCTGGSDVLSKFAMA